MLVLRLRAEPTHAEINSLNREFGDLLTSGRIERSAPLPPELADKDMLDLPRLTLHMDQRSVGGLFRLIGAINAFGSAAH